MLYEKQLPSDLAVVFHNWNTLRIIFMPFLKVYRSICESSDVLEEGYLELFNSKESNVIYYSTPILFFFFFFLLLVNMLRGYQNAGNL